MFLKKRKFDLYFQTMYNDLTLNPIFDLLILKFLSLLAFAFFRFDSYSFGCGMDIKSPTQMNGIQLYPTKKKNLRK